jgi:hypothetical protein
MPAYRVYYLDGSSIIAADMIEAETSAKATVAATAKLTARPFRLSPNRLEVWEGTTFWHETSLPTGFRADRPAQHGGLDNGCQLTPA